MKEITNKKWSIDRIELILCYITVFSYIVFGNAITYNLANRFPVKVAEIFSLITIVVILINRFRKKEKILSFDKIDIKILIWLGIGLFSTIINAFIYDYSISSMIYGTLYSVRIAHLLVLTSIIFDIFKKNKIETKKALNFILISYLIVSVIGFIQMIFFPIANDFYDVFYAIGIYYANPDPHIERLISTYFDPNFFSCCLLIPTIISLYLYSKDKDKKYLAYYIVYLVAIILTVSRSGLLGLFIVLALFILFNIKIVKRKLHFEANTLKVILCTLIVSLVLYFTGNFKAINRIEETLSSMFNKETINEVISNNDNNSTNNNQNSDNTDSQNSSDKIDDSALARFKSWEFALDIMKKNPVVGIGFNMIGVHKDRLKMNENTAMQYGVDSSLLLIAMTTGLIGVCYFAYIVIKYCKMLIKNWNNIYAKSIIIILVSSFIVCNFNNLLFYILWLFPLLLIMKFFNCELVEQEVIKDEKVSKVEKKETKNKKSKKSKVK